MLGTHDEDRRERREGCRGPTRDADGLDALKDGDPQEVHVCWAVELLPQVLHSEVDGGVLFRRDVEAKTIGRKAVYMSASEIRRPRTSVAAVSINMSS